MRLLIVALAALAALLLPRAAAAEERILRFESNIVVARDGTLDVTETIRVRVENIAINHGIYRDFPTKYRATGGRSPREQQRGQRGERNNEQPHRARAAGIRPWERSGSPGRRPHNRALP